MDRHRLPGRSARRHGAGLPGQEPAVLAGFSARRRVGPVGAPPADGAEKEVRGDRDHHPVQGRCRRRADVVADEHPARRRAQHRGCEPAAHRVPAHRGPGAIQDAGHHAGVLVPLHARHPGGARAEPDQEFRGLHQGGQGQPRQAEFGRLWPELGQPCSARALQRGVWRQDHLCAVQGHGRHGHLGHGRAGRWCDDLHRVCHQQQDPYPPAGGGHGQASSADAGCADVQGARCGLGGRCLPRHRCAPQHAARDPQEDFGHVGGPEQ